MYIYIFVVQVELVDMETSTAKATAWTQQHLAQHCSTMVSAAALASRSSARTIPPGATPAAHQSSSPPLTSARQTTLSPTTMVGGATLLALTSTWPCPCSSRSLSTVLVLSLLPTVGKPATSPSSFVLFCIPLFCVLKGLFSSNFSQIYSYRN